MKNKVINFNKLVCLFIIVGTIFSISLFLVDAQALGDEECIEEGENLGAVIPGNVNECCSDLEPYIPREMVGTRGTCQKINYCETDLDCSEKLNCVGAYCSNNKCFCGSDYLTCASCEECTEKIKNAEQETLIKLTEDLSGSYDHFIEGIYANFTYDACILFDNSNITFDCNGKDIIGKEHGLGIFMRDGEEDMGGWSKILPSRRNTLKNCKISNYEVGINLWVLEDNNIIKNNTLELNERGLFQQYGFRTQIIDNNFNSNEYGIFLYGHSQDNIVSNNNLNKNTFGILSITHSNNNIILSNNLSENNIAIHIEDSDFNEITNNELELNGLGIRFYGLDVDSSKNLLSENIINNNQLGILLQGNVLENILTSNTICYNEEYGDIKDQTVEENIGNNNFCSETINWNDVGIDDGCKFKCDVPKVTTVSKPKSILDKNLNINKEIENKLDLQCENGKGCKAIKGDVNSLDINNKYTEEKSFKKIILGWFKKLFGVK